MPDHYYFQMAENLIRHYASQLRGNLSFWELIGFVGQGIFCTRFLVQWIASEKKKRSVIPDAFWYLSLVGSTILLVYGLGLKRPSLIAAYLFNNIVYLRNLVLIHRHRRQEAAAAAGDATRGVAPAADPPPAGSEPRA
jgi:lipid-A-disaccharide synthase-like uncharacterized protein